MNIDIEKNDVLLIRGDLYRVIACYDTRKTPLTYDLQHVENESDRMMVTNKQMSENINAENWQKVDLPQ